jgi:hypothetical protein
MSYLSDYNSGDRSKKEKDAFDVLVTDLMSSNLTGQTKSKELTAQDMESHMATNFMPTMFYIFMYVRQQPEKMKNAEFYDVCPMILCTSVDAKTVTGINFNIIPNNIRAVFLDIVTGDYQQFYNEMRITSPDRMVVNNKLGSILTSEKGLSYIIAYINAKTGVDLSSAIRKYDRSCIIKTRMIEYDQWHYIPFLSFKDSVRGVSLAALQAELIDKNVDK